MLRLLHSPASPFARKVRMAALERGVRLELELAAVHPVQRNEELAALNPLAKIPVLLTPEGPIYDSRIICRYLDRRGEGPSLYVSERADVWEILTLEALADGIMDAAVANRYELAVRPEALRWPSWSEAQFVRIDAALDLLETKVPRLGGGDVGSLGMGAALEYLDFRHPVRPWRGGRPRLAAWLADFAQSPAMQRTSYPKD